MIKQRIWVWLLLIAVTWGSFYSYQYLSQPREEIIIEYNNAISPELSSLRDIDFFGLKTSFNIKNPNVIISTDKIEKSDFTPHDNFLYSPIILYTGDYALNSTSGFSVSNLNSDKTYRTAQKNITPILIGIEQNKTWQDIGISEDCLKGKINVAVPDKNSPYRKYVEQLFLVNLDVEITEENIEELLVRVDKIMAKCEQVENIEVYLNNKFEKLSDSNLALFAPEFFLAKNRSLYNNSYSSKGQRNIEPIYPTKTIAIKYNLYTKNDMSETLCDKVLNKYSSSKILTKLGLRPSDTNVDYTKLDYHIITDVNLISIDNNLLGTINSHIPFITENTVYQSEDSIIENKESQQEKQTVEKNSINEDSSNEDDTEETEETNEESEKSSSLGFWFWAVIIFFLVIIMIFVVLAGNELGW